MSAMSDRMEKPILPDPEWGSTFEPGVDKENELFDILARMPIFDTLNAAEIREVERIVHRRNFVKGEMVIRAWIPRSGLFVVLSGSVDVVHQSGSEMMVIGTLEAGELLGEFAVLDDSPRSTHIVAAEASELIGFFRPDLMDLMETNPTCGFKILYRMSQIMSSRLVRVVDDLRRLRATLS